MLESYRKPGRTLFEHQFRESSTVSVSGFALIDRRFAATSGQIVIDTER
jgi:hypothetical protein